MRRPLFYFLLFFFLPWAKAITGQSASVTQADGAVDDLSGLSWMSPSSGTSFATGDTITCKWTVKKPLSSPSFRLCMQPSSTSISNSSEKEQAFLSSEKQESDYTSSTGSPSDPIGTSNCGTAIWPPVTEDQGVYSALISVPDTSDPSGFYLLVKDDLGTTTRSPRFTLGSHSTANNAASTAGNAPPDDSRGSESGSPGESPQSTGSGSGNGGQMVATVPPPSDVSSPVVSQEDVSTPTTYPNSELPSSISLPANPASLYTKSSAPPVAALAIPLSLVGATLLLAGALFAHRRRKHHRLTAAGNAPAPAAVSTVNKTPRDHEGRNMSGFMSDQYDLEKAVSALTMAVSRIPSLYSSKRRSESNDNPHYSSPEYDYEHDLGWSGRLKRAFTRRDSRRRRPDEERYTRHSERRNTIRWKRPSLLNPYSTYEIPHDEERGFANCDAFDEKSVVTEAILADYLDPSPPHSPQLSRSSTRHKVRSRSLRSGGGYDLEAYYGLPMLPQRAKSRPQAPSFPYKSSSANLRRDHTWYIRGNEDKDDWYSTVSREVDARLHRI